MYKENSFLGNPGYRFIAPAIVLIMLLFGYPVFKIIQFSLSEISLTTLQPVRWVGFDNFWDTLITYRFVQILRNTFVWTTGSLVGQIGLGFAAALLLNKKIRGITFFRIVIMLPYVTPGVVIAIVWLFFYDTEFGLFNPLFIEAFGGEKFSVLSSASTALPAVILVNIWYMFPFSSMVIRAGLQGIPGEIYSAAKVDGASRFQLFRYITLPSLRPVLRLLVVLQGIWAINTFAFIWIMTRGGPGYSSSILGVLAYEYSFNFLHFEKGAAVALILLGVSLVFGYIQLRVTARKEETII